MSISLSVAVQIPTNVVEVGNEISTQQLGAITSGSGPTSANPFTTVSYINGLSFATQSYVTTRGYITNSALSGYATETYVTTRGYLTDAPSDGSEYVRKNAAWAVVTGGGGGISDAPSDGSLYARQNAAWASFTIPTVPPASVTNIDLTGNFNGYSMGSGYYSFKYDSAYNTLRMQDGVGFGTTVSTRGIDETVSNISITTALDATHSNVLYVLTPFYTINIPQDSTYSFPIGKRFFVCSPAGSIVDASMTSVSLNGVIGGNYTLPNGVSTLIKVAADTWYIS